MKYDAHTPCPVCAVQVRSAFDAFAVLVALVEGSRVGDWERLVTEAAENARLALDRLRPFMDAHHRNHLHAFSPALDGARQPGEPEEIGPEQRALKPIDGRD